MSSKNIKVPSERRVRVAYAGDTITTFTQRGTDPNRGFIRMGGKLITGYLTADHTSVNINPSGKLFYAEGINAQVPFTPGLTRLAS